MSIVVETVSAVVIETAATTITLVKPTGLVVGNLMVAILGGYGATAGVHTGVFSTLATWTSAVGGNFLDNVSQSVQFKVATAGDVAAADFTFTNTSTSPRLTGILLRCSGNNTVEGGLGTTDQETDSNVDVAAFTGSLSAYTPPVAGALVIFQLGRRDPDSNFRTVSGYTVVNTTFTEAYDVERGGTSDVMGVAAAYGVQSTASSISTYTATFSAAVNDHFGQLAVFNPPVPASGSNTLATTNSAHFTQAGTCDTIGGANVLTESTGVALPQGGIGANPTVWTPQVKTATTWTQETK